ncbi:hypothetical protein Q3G72_022150 [Acer saccharum]|nr:hypothetical protein Q3G72_022150 [Acer saccharum]
MNGNHEIMNIEADFRSVTRNGLKEFENWANWFSIGSQIKSLCVGLEKPSDIFPQEYQHATRARVAALRPDGPIARRINEEARDWINGLTGKFAPAPPYCRGRNSLIWLRKYSNELAKDCDYSALEHVLATIPGVKRMIMGHTIQEVGINGICDDRAIRIDVGMSKGCINGLPEVLEINGNSGLRILTSNPLYQNKSKAYLNTIIH